MKTIICTYKEANLYQILHRPYARRGEFQHCSYSIRAKKSDLHPDGIDTFSIFPDMAKEKAIKGFKEKIDKHLYACKNLTNLDDLLEMEDYQPENTSLLQWESDLAFDAGGDWADNWE